jgi:hypothetical protein
MPDYKKIYLTMLRASAQAVNILIAAQQECEEQYISSPGPKLTMVPLQSENKKDADDKEF